MTETHCLLERKKKHHKRYVGVKKSVGFEGTRAVAALNPIIRNICVNMKRDGGETTKKIGKQIQMDYITKREREPTAKTEKDTTGILQAVNRHT